MSSGSAFIPPGLRLWPRQGEHDAAWPVYVAAIESGNAGEHLVRFVGRFNQDPLPVLQGQLARTPTDRYAWAALQSVCHIEQRWWPTLIPFVHRVGLGYQPKAGDTKFYGFELGRAVEALVRMDRRDLAREVMDGVDWSLVGKMKDYADHPTGLESFRELMDQSPDMPQAC